MNFFWPKISQDFHSLRQCFCLLRYAISFYFFFHNFSSNVHKNCAFIRRNESDWTVHRSVKNNNRGKNFHFERNFNSFKSDFNNELELRGARKFGERETNTHQMFFMYISQRNNSRSFRQLPFLFYFIRMIKKTQNNKKWIFQIQTTGKKSYAAAVAVDLWTSTEILSKHRVKSTIDLL